MEQTGSAKPGNRGKRDSQLVIMGYFNRVYHGRELTELDAAIEDALIDLNMQSDDMRLLMTIDADTRVEELSVTHMTYAMNQNDRILALCGETKVDNKWQSWVTVSFDEKESEMFVFLISPPTRTLMMGIYFLLNIRFSDDAGVRVLQQPPHEEGVRVGVRLCDVPPGVLHHVPHPKRRRQAATCGRSRVRGVFA